MVNTFDFGGGEDETATDKVAGIAETLAGAEAVQVGLLALDVHGVDRVQTEPRREREPVLLRPLGQRRQHHRRSCIHQRVSQLISVILMIAAILHHRLIEPLIVKI